MTDKNEGSLAGKHRDMGIKTIEGQDNEGHVHGSKQSEFKEQTDLRRAQEDESSFNREDARSGDNMSSNV
jgi:hypothetical protein